MNATMKYDYSFDVDAEHYRALEPQLERSAALSVNGTHYALHHDRKGRPNWRAVLCGMTRLLTGELQVSDAQRDEIYDHLAGHYTEAGVIPPEARLLSADEAHALALEGRLAHLDDDGDAWVYTGLVDAGGGTLARFVAIDDSAEKLCVLR